MDDLMSPVVRWMRMGRPWPRLIILSAILALAIVGSMPAAAAPPQVAEWPNCNWVCTANDVQVTGAWLGGSPTDPTVELPASCLVDETAYLWVEIENTTSADRYAYGVIADVVVDGTTVAEDQVNCVSGALAGKETATVMLYDFDWPCGAQVLLQDVVVFWDVNETECTNECNQYPPAQCEALEEFEVEVPCELEVGVTPTEATLTCGQPTATLMATVGDVDSAEVHYTWYRGTEQVGTDSNTYTADEPGNYKVVVTVGSCSAESPWVAVEDYRTVDVEVSGAQDLTCEKTEVTLTAEVTLVEDGTDENEVTYAWYKDEVEGTPIGEEESITVSAAGTYYVVVTYGACSAQAHATVNDVCVPEYELAITKTGDVTTAKLGDTIHYTITVKNMSDVELTDVTVDDDKLDVHETIGTLAAGESWSDTFEYTVTAEDVEKGKIVNTATADSEETEPVSASWTVYISEEPEPVCTRADVSAIIYGGWNGIPVKATVGGTPQETLYTALDAFGEPAVLWTFYPPEGETWTVVVTPELPAGLNPEEWKYEPTSRTVSITRCSEHQVTFQLINFKPQVEVILPVTGGEPAGMTWWQALVQWLRGLLG